MSSESISCSESLFNSGHWFGERLFARLAVEASLLNFKKDSLIPNGSVFNPNRNVVINCFRRSGTLWTHLELRKLHGLKMRVFLLALLSLSCNEWVKSRLGMAKTPS
jgi:hypothetical protein